MRKIAFRSAALAALFVMLFSPRALACSVFFSADANQAFFCSNEDGENGNTYLWFLPAGEGAYGAVFFSYEDAWVQGGMNEKGLALDWATTEPQKMNHYRDRVSPVGNKNRLYAGNLNETILKTCATLDDVISLYARCNEIAFENAHVMVADRSGASAIFEWHDGEFRVIKRTGTHQEMTNVNATRASANGYSFAADDEYYSYTRYYAIKNTLDKAGEVSFNASRSALTAASDPLTQYSYVCDLKNGVVTVYDKRNFGAPRQFALADELKKGAHILTTGMQPFAVDEKYRRMGAINNQNLFAAGKGSAFTLAACAAGAALAVLCMALARRRRIYILPAAADLTVIPLGLGLMHYGYFLRYGFTLGEGLLLWLPVLYVALAAALLVCAAVLLIGGKGRGYIPFHINTAVSTAIAAALLANVIF